MDEIIQKAIAQNQALRRVEVPWETDKPHHQGYWSWEAATSQWQPREPTSGVVGGGAASALPSRLALFAWNIDFMLPHAHGRMERAVAHLCGLVEALPATTAVVVFLQECVVSDLKTIGQRAWVRERFHVTEAAAVGSANWASGHYGTTTLVDCRLPLRACFRVHYSQTNMERDAFFVDVEIASTTVGSSGSSTGGGGGSTGPPTRIIRLCNTHLESLALDPPLRPPQVALVASYLNPSQSTSSTVSGSGSGSGGDGVPHAGLMAGDFNAIQDFDRTLHTENGLEDAYLALGGAEDSDEGFTWGQQAATTLRERFGCSRMDKVFYRGGVRVLRFARFGAGVELDGLDMREKYAALGFDRPWITDHLGIVAEFDVVD
jgi:tyrosyl-DNA phosphodiesterase 2